jgi:SAM-dependent methyltransferase
MEIIINKISCMKCEYFNNEKKECLSIVNFLEQISPIRRCLCGVLKSSLRDIRNKSVLEIGCGYWDYAKQILENNNCSWMGLEPIRTDVGKSIATTVGSVENMPYENESFDVVLGNQCLEHWYSTNVSFERGLDEIYRVLKKEGQLILNVPIYLHGHYFFEEFQLDEIIMIFAEKKWRKLIIEEWRKDYTPLPPYIPFYPRISKSAWIMNIITYKI